MPRGFKYDIEDLSTKLLDVVADLLDEFDVKYQDHDNRIMFACPIHDGDNPTGSSIMKTGVGNWKCFTNECHEQHGSSILQFTQALLTTYYNKEYTFLQTLDWVADFLGEELSIIQQEDPSQTQFIQLCKFINRKKNYTPVFTPRNLVQNFLKIPAEYYIKRGYTEKVLCKFDIGHCFNEKKSFFDRIITPFYDDDGKYMIGCSGRNKYEKCEKCNTFHNPNTRCPITKDEQLRSTKWKHSTNFAADSYLYNYWNAKTHILDTMTVVLVEGPGDVWRLEEAGINNSLALLGARLSQNQQIILEQSGAINILIATDNDDVGQKAANKIYDNCRNIFNIKRIQYPGKDPGSLTIEQIKQIFIPILERI